MKKTFKVIVTYLLILSLLMTSVLSVDFANIKAEANEEVVTEEAENNEDEVDEEDEDEEYEIEQEVELTYQITSQWDKHYNLDVTLTNVTDEKIDDWEIRIPVNFKIENIWNAKITDEQEGEYTIHNAEWNQDIPLDGSVTFGMTIAAEEEPQLPQYCEMVRMCLGVMDEYEVEYTEYSKWDNHVNGKISITNKTDRTIEDWSLSLECNFKIENIWNASIVESYEAEDGEEVGYSYKLENVVNNQNIRAGQAVEFGFIATCEGEVELSTKQLFEMIEDDGEVDYEYEEEEDYEYDEIVWDEDAFETSEEYREYLNSLDEETETSATTYRLRKGTRASTSMITLLEGKMEDTICFGEKTKPIQNYLPMGEEVYTLHHSLKNKNDAYLKKRKDDDTFSTETLMEGFAHGQTFEQVKYKTKEYFLLAGKASGEFAKNIVFMRKNKFEELFTGKELKFATWEQDKTIFTRLCGLEYSNETATKRGKITRTDAALTADGKVLVIWKQLYKNIKSKKKKDIYIIEVSFYNMNKVNKCLFKKKNKKYTKTMKPILSFNGKYKEALKKACIGSVRERYVKDTDNTKRILQPEGSFQAIDVEWTNANKKDRLQVYITSGNENKDLNPHDKLTRKKNLTIMYLDCELSSKLGGKKAAKLKKCTSYRNLITCDKKEMGKTINEKSILEIEGCHVIDNALHYVIVPSGAVSKETQFIYSIPVSQLKDKTKQDLELKVGKMN